VLRRLVDHSGLPQHVNLGLADLPLELVDLDYFLAPLNYLAVEFLGVKNC